MSAARHTATRRARAQRIGLHLTKRWAVLCALGFGCGSTPPPDSTLETSAAAAGAEQAPPETPPPPPRAQRQVQVSGIEGTLHAYDVRDTMERRLDALAACQRTRIRKVRPLAGSVELAIHVLTDGTVSQVDVIQSDLGDIETERCIAQVTRDTKFPQPNGGEADVKWNMVLDPLSSKNTAEPFDAEELAEPLELLLPDASERCALTRGSPRLHITAYVAPSGKVLAAGAASAQRGLDEVAACVARDVTTWQLPKRKRIGKVTFEARYRPPINDAQRNAIRKKHAQRRKVEQKRKQAEAKREAKRRKRSRG